MSAKTHSPSRVLGSRESQEAAAPPDNVITKSHPSSPAEYEAKLPFVLPPQIDEYRLVRPLGRGGMGQVILGRDTLLERNVAVKFLVTRTPSEQALKRFLIEARAIAKVSHNNVVAVYRVGVADGLPYLVSEFVTGNSLDHVKTPLPWPEVLRIAIDLTRGLEAVHRQGILHRDLKPGNAMWMEDGTVKLLDFGLAKLSEELKEMPASFPTGSQGNIPTTGIQPEEADALDSTADATADDHSLPHELPVDTRSPLANTASAEEAPQAHSSSASIPAPEFSPTPQPPIGKQLTGTGVIIGTPAYMPPEMWLGAPATERSDIYMLGVLLYELCSGKRPHNATQRAELRKRVLHVDAPPLRTRAASVNPRLAAAIDACVQRDPRQRIGSATELLQLLQEIAADPTEEGKRLRRQAKLRQALTLAGALACLLAVIAGRVYPSAGVATTTISMERPRPRMANLGIRALSEGGESARGFASAFAELVDAELSAGERLLLIPSGRTEQMKLELALPIANTYSPQILQRIRQQLEPDMLLSGQVYAAENKQLRVVLTVMNAQTGQPIATHIEQGEPAKLFTMAMSAGKSLRQHLGVDPLRLGERGELRAMRPASLAAAQLYGEGKSKLRQLDPVAAQRLLLQVVQLEPDFPLGHFGLAEALQALGYEERARQEVRRAFELSTNLRQVERTLIEAKYRETIKEWPKALALYRALWTSFPDDPDYGFALANAQLSAEQADEALQTISRLRRQLPRLATDSRLEQTEARAMLQRNDYLGAVSALQKAAQRQEAAGTPILLASTLLLQAFSYMHLGEHALALQQATRAHELASKAGDQSGSIDSQIAISTALSALGNLAQAAQVNESTLKQLLRSQNDVLTAVHLGNMADLLCQLGQLDLATARADSGLLLARQIGNQEARTQAMVTLGYVARLRGDAAAAASYFEEARSDAVRDGNTMMEAWIAWHVGELRALQGRFAEAQAQHLHALKLRQQNHLAGYVSESQLALAQLSLAQRNPQDAERYVRSALQEFVQAQSRQWEPLARAVLASALLMQGHRESAQQQQQLAEELLPSLQNLPLRLQTLALLADLSVKSSILNKQNPNQIQEKLIEGIRQARQSGLVAEEFNLLATLSSYYSKRTQPAEPWVTQRFSELAQISQANGIQRRYLFSEQ